MALVQPYSTQLVSNGSEASNDLTIALKKGAYTGQRSDILKGYIYVETIKLGKERTLATCKATTSTVNAAKN